MRRLQLQHPALTLLATYLYFSLPSDHITLSHCSQSDKKPKMGQTSILSLPDELLGLIVDHALPQEASSVDCLGRVAADPTPLLYTNRKFHCLTREVYYQKWPMQLYISGTASSCSQQSGCVRGNPSKPESSIASRKQSTVGKVPWPLFKKVDIHLYPDVSYLDLQTSIPDVVQHMRQLEDHLYDILSPYNEHRFLKRNQLTLAFHESCPFHQTTLSVPRSATALPYWSRGSVSRTLGQSAFSSQNETLSASGTSPP